MLLSRFPRVSLAHLPTPLEHLPRLSAESGGSAALFAYRVLPDPG
jgi:1-aminocyclopropane-1-carboxylate deaminase/D-cysteine desulfhydrase-like pyridoxal-dependent ACC family enzyme